MLQTDLICHEDSDFLVYSGRAYQALQAVIAKVRDQLNPDLDVDTAATFYWAGIQGLVALAPKLADVANDNETAFTPIDALVDQFATYMVEGMAKR